MKPQIQEMVMATRVLEFLAAHPFSDRNQASIAARFTDQVAEAKALLRAEREQRLAAVAGSRQRQELRRHLESHLVRSVARVGKIALRNTEQVASRFAAPAADRTDATFVTHATTLLEAARAHQDALVGSGLKRAQLQELAAGLQQFETLLAQAHTDRRQLQETRAALAQAGTSLAELLVLLDVCNRDRFRGDATLLGLWTSLRKVKRRASRRRGGEVDDAAEVPAVTPPAAGAGDEVLPPDGGLTDAA